MFCGKELLRLRSHIAVFATEYNIGCSVKCAEFELGKRFVCQSLKVFSYFYSVFTPINCFCFVLQNTFFKIEIFAEYQYLFSVSCLGYCVMERISTVQRVLIIKTFYKNEEFAMQTERKLRTVFGRNDALCETTVRRLMTKFETTGPVLTVNRLSKNVVIKLRNSLFLCKTVWCHCQSRKINSPTFAAIEYAVHFIASNFAYRSPHARAQNSTYAES